MELAPGWFFDNIASIFYFPNVVYLFLNLFHWQSLAGVFFLATAAFFLLASHLVGKLRRQKAQASNKRIAIINFQTNTTHLKAREAFFSVVDRRLVSVLPELSIRVLMSTSLMIHSALSAKKLMTRYLENVSVVCFGDKIPGLLSHHRR